MSCICECECFDEEPSILVKKILEATCKTIIFLGLFALVAGAISTNLPDGLGRPISRVYEFSWGFSICDEIPRRLRGAVLRVYGARGDAVLEL